MRDNLEDYRKPLLSKKKEKLLKRFLHNRFTCAVEDLTLSLLRPMPMTPVNDVELKVLGMRRSGNHAILTWILRSANTGMPDKDHIFLNNCKLIENAYRLQSDYRSPEYSNEEYSLIKERRNRSYRKTGVLIRSFEDFDTMAFRTPENQAYYGRSRKKITATILRDPLNLFASRIKVGYIEAKTKLSLIDLYLDNARALDDSSFEHPILYNKWLLSQNYRSDLLVLLGITGPDIHDDKPARFGPGSSFQKQESPLHSQDLLSRWIEFRHDPWFAREILGNTALMAIIEQYFPEILSTY
ncbi:MAG: hypothetical protein AAGF33_00130 [Pseudomonadota bacterium]